MASNSEGKAVDKDGYVAKVSNDVGNDVNEEKASASAELDHAQQAGEKSTGRGWRWFALLLMVLLLAIVGAVAWYGFKIYQGIDSASQHDQQQAAQLASLNDQWEAEKAAGAASETELTKQIADVQQALNTQAKEIVELNSLDRDQWVYAELEYLVRLANQRLLTERRPQGALVLLEAADKLLGSLDDGGALSVRGVLAKDISALRLVELVDREGIYSRLGALTPTVLGLAALPSEKLGELVADSTVDNLTDIEAQDLEDDGGEKVETVDTSMSAAASATNSTPTGTWYHQLWLNAKAALSRFSQDHFHVRYRDVAIEPLISTDQEQWLRYDMAINISNAQQALLRDEQGIYLASLTTIGNHLQRYFLGSHEARTLMMEVEALGEVNVKQDLPDITSSIEALRQLQAASSRGAVVGGVVQ